MVLTYAGLLDYNNSDSEASASQALTLRWLATCALKSWPPRQFCDKKVGYQFCFAVKKLDSKQEFTH